MSTRMLLGAAAALAISALPAAAQDSGWNAWQGCWRPAGVDGSSQVVCVVPAAESRAVRLVTIADGVVAGEIVLHADGVARPVDEGGCTGTEKATFSQDGRRVFTRAELSCDGVRRVSTGVLALVTELEWIDAQAVTVGEQHATRVVRYRAAETPAALADALPDNRGMARGTARLHAAAPLTVEHVIEAARMVAPPVVEALLAAREHGYDLNPRTLVALRDAGVNASTIDIMVALSYPQRFAVRAPQPQPAVDEFNRTRGQFGYASERECDPFRSMRRYSFDDCYDRYGYGYGYGSRYGYDRYYSPYSPYGRDPYGWNWDTPIVVVVPTDSNENDGTVVKGSGYTRSGNSSGSATSRASSGRDSSSGSTARGTSTTTTRSTSGTNSGSANTGSSSSTGRSAKPRGGG